MYICRSSVGHALVVVCLCSCNFVPAHSALPAVLITYFICLFVGSSVLELGSAYTAFGVYVRMYFAYYM